MNPIDDLQLAYALAVTICLGIAALRDLTERRIPNAVPAALVILYPGVFALGLGPAPWWGGLAVGSAVFAVAAALFAGNILGGGDAKLLGVVALWAGPAWALEALLVTGLLGGVAAMARLLRPLLLTPVLGPQPGARETSLPYGVAIAGGGLWVAGRMAGL